MTEKHIEFDINDEKASEIAKILGNKTAKKILNLLAEKELSENDISKELKLPINTVEYNLKKLINSGLVEKTSSFFWSVKGKRIPVYRIANKKIIISPAKKIGGVLSSAIIGGLVLGAFKIFNNSWQMRIERNTFLDNLPTLIAKDSSLTIPATSTSPASVGELASNVQSFVQTTSSFQDIWVWILAGLAIGMSSYLIFKSVKGGFKNKHG